MAELNIRVNYEPRGTVDAAALQSSLSGAIERELAGYSVAGGGYVGAIQVEYQAPDSNSNSDEPAE